MVNFHMVNFHMVNIHLVNFLFFQSIPESKLKAFEVGTMSIGRKALSKREQEELRKKV